MFNRKLARCKARVDALTIRALVWAFRQGSLQKYLLTQLLSLV